MLREKNRSNTINWEIIDHKMNIKPKFYMQEYMAHQHAVEGPILSRLNGRKTSIFFNVFFSRGMMSLIMKSTEERFASKMKKIYEANPKMEKLPQLKINRFQFEAYIGILLLFDVTTKMFIPQETF